MEFATNTYPRGTLGYLLIGLADDATSVAVTTGTRGAVEKTRRQP
jgi:hypothetical protein